MMIGILTEKKNEDRNTSSSGYTDFHISLVQVY